MVLSRCLVHESGNLFRIVWSVVLPHPLPDAVPLPSSVTTHTIGRPIPEARRHVVLEGTSRPDLLEFLETIHAAA